MRDSVRVSTEDRYTFALSTLERLREERAIKTVFDVGAGEGVLRERVDALGLDWRGFDIDPQLEVINVWDVNVSISLDEDSPDVVLLLDVLEHCGNPELVLTNIAKLLNEAGTIVLTVPNPRWSKSRLSALFTGYPSCFTQADLDDNNHVFPPWPHIVEMMLRKAGFHIAETAQLDGPTEWPDMTRIIRAPHVIVSRLVCMLIERFDKTACGMSYGLVATKSGQVGRRLRP